MEKSLYKNSIYHPPCLFRGQHVNESMLREDPGNEVEFHFELILRVASFLSV